MQGHNRQGIQASPSGGCEDAVWASSSSAPLFSPLDSVSRESGWEELSSTSPSTSSAGGRCECTCAEHTTAVSTAAGDACDTRSNQDCRCLASEEEELCDVMVLTGEDSDPLAASGTAEEYGGGRVPWKVKNTVRRSVLMHQLCGGVEAWLTWCVPPGGPGAPLESCRVWSVYGGGGISVLSASSWSLASL